jgi:hypothetical protein
MSQEQNLHIRRRERLKCVFLLVLPAPAPVRRVLIGFQTRYIFSQYCRILSTIHVLYSAPNAISDA